MKITGEEWVVVGEDASEKRTKNVVSEVRTTRKERHLILECGHRVPASQTNATIRTQCPECEPDTALAEQAAARLDEETARIKAKLEGLQEHLVLGRMLNILDELKFDIQKGYRPTLDELDALIAEIKCAQSSLVGADPL